jgi:hypothetical protein
MKMSLWGKRFLSSVLLFSLTWILVLWSVDSGWTQDKSGEAVGTNAQAEESLDLLRTPGTANRYRPARDLSASSFLARSAQPAGCAKSVQ